jgi:flavin-dependent dehydrogenase
MAKIVVLGAGLAGLATAMLLNRDGHRVTVLERDPAEPPARPVDAWAEWERRGVNQFRLPHLILARWLAVARAELPELVEALESGGIHKYTLGEGLDGLTARRPVFEAAMSHAAVAAGVEIRRGVTVTAAGLAELRVDADLVVDCLGRRSPVGGWLGEAVEEREDSGFVYYARHFQGQPPEVRGTFLQPYESLSILTLPADHDTWSVVFVTSARDKALRALRSPSAWAAALAQYPLVAHWGRGTPLAPGVDVMAGIEDRHRRYVVDGVVPVGDAWACTNPSVGRGASMAMLHAVLLRDVLRSTALEKVAVRFDEVTTEVLEPLYRQTVAADRHRLAEIDGDVSGVPYTPEDVGFWMSKSLYCASLTDPDVARAYYAIASFVATPPEAIGPVIDKVRAAAPERYPLPGPTRAGLLQALSLT